jgi:tetratricopeptide (TPR) repeat protein
MKSIARFGLLHGVAALAVSAGGMALPASANTAVLGSSLARSCYEAAEAGRQPRALREAMRICDGALEADELPLDHRIATHINRGIVQMRARQYAAAIADYDAAIRLRPESAEAYVNKGIALMNWGDRANEAVDMLSAGIELGPLKPEFAYFNRAIANETLGRTRNAYEDYARAAQLAPGWADPVTELQRFQTVKRKTAGV